MDEVALNVIFVKTIVSFHMATLALRDLSCVSTFFFCAKREKKKRSAKKKPSAFLFVVFKMHFFQTTSSLLQ